MATTRVRGTVMALLAVVVLAGLGATDRETSLLEAVKSGDVAAVRALLRQKAGATATEPDGTTALTWAVRGNQQELATLLLKAGADPSKANRYGASPVFYAATNGNGPLLETLLAAGAKANAPGVGGEMPLMAAARSGSTEAVRVLLAHGADVHAREARRGQTALMAAAVEGNAAVVKTLVEAGARATDRSHGPATPPLDAAEFTRGNYNRKDRFDEYTPLLMAVRRGHLDVVRALLDAGVSPNEKAPDGASALVIAAANAHWELGALLLDRGADPNAADQGWNALHQTARTRGLNVTRLAYPVPTGRLSSMDFVKSLFAHGVDVHARVTKAWGRSDNQRGRFSVIRATALLMAAKSADAELMRVLLEHGANVQDRNREGTTVLMAAAGCDVTFVGEDSKPPEEALEAVKVALAAGGTVNDANEKGDTALHGAAFTGANIVVQFLVDKGAKLDAVNKYGQSPLAVAHLDYQGQIDQYHPETEAFIRKLLAERGLPEGKVFGPAELRQMFVASGVRGNNNLNTVVVETESAPPAGAAAGK